MKCTHSTETSLVTSATQQTVQDQSPPSSSPIRQGPSTQLTSGIAQLIREAVNAHSHYEREDCLDLIDRMAKVLKELR